MAWAGTIAYYHQHLNYFTTGTIKFHILDNDAVTGNSLVQSEETSKSSARMYSTCTYIKVHLHA